ncbi:MAG: ParB/RepB/Spo0J family partition protein [Thermoanaerobaculia bacterium]
MTAKRRGLGRGLDALLDAQPASEPRALPISRLRPNRFQPRSRFDETGLEELADSIRAQGIVQPLVVAPDSGGDFVIVAGERRWRAAQRAGLAEVPVVVRAVDDDRQLLEMALVENLQRTDLNAVEEADAYRALAEEFGLAQEEVARRVGKSRSAVTNALRLLRLPPEVLDLLREGALSAGQARPLVPLSEERAVELARRAAAQGLSARQIERLAGERRPSSKPAARIDPDTAAAADRLTRRLQTRVDIRRRGRGGRILIRFHDEEELMRLFDLFMQRGGGADGSTAGR